MVWCHVLALFVFKTCADHEENDSTDCYSHNVKAVHLVYPCLLPTVSQSTVQDLHLKTDERRRYQHSLSVARDADC